MENNIPLPPLSEEDQALAREAGDSGLEFLKSFGQNPAHGIINEALKNAIFVAFAAGYRAGAKSRDIKKKLILQ